MTSSTSNISDVSSIDSGASSYKSPAAVASCSNALVPIAPAPKEALDIVVVGTVAEMTLEEDSGEEEDSDDEWQDPGPPGV